MVLRGPVVDVDHATPRDGVWFDVEGVALVQVIVDHCRQEVVGSGDGVEIASEVQVELLHGKHLGVPGPGSAALDAEGRPHRGLTQGEHRLPTDLLESLGQSDCRRRLALAQWSGGHCGDDDVLGTGASLVGLLNVQGHLGDVAAVMLEVALRDRGPVRNMLNGLEASLPGDLQIRLHRHVLHIVIT